MKKINSIISLFPRANKKGSILSIFAHPDDELSVAGMLLLAHQENVETHLACFTLGGKGTLDASLEEKEVEKIRKKELQNAADILQIKHLYTPEFRDGGLASNYDDVYRVVCDLIESINPAVVVTHNPTGTSGHPDHITLSKAVYFVLKNHSFPAAGYFSIPHPLKIQLYPKQFNRSFMENMPQATYYLMRSGKMDSIQKALAQHNSQIDSNPWIGKFINFIDADYFHRIELNASYKFHYVPFHGGRVNFFPDNYEKK